MDGNRSFDEYRMPDAMWDRMKPLLPKYVTSPVGGRPRKDLRRIADAIFYRMRTGCQWKAVPPSLAPGSTASVFQYTTHIRSRGEEQEEMKRRRGERPRRWVVERTHSWFNRFRAILVRWEKQIDNHVAALHLACAYFTLSRARVFG